MPLQSNQTVRALVARARKLIQALTSGPVPDANTSGTEVPSPAAEGPAGFPGHPGNGDAAFDIDRSLAASLRDDESFFRQMFERHSSAMLLIDPKAGVIIKANHAAANFYGYSPDELSGMSVDRINAQPESEIAPQRELAMRSEKSHFVFDHRLASGAVRSVEVHISPISYKGRSLFFSVVHDITERKRADEQIHNLAFYDALTGLPNRRLLKDRLAHAIASSKRSHRYYALLLLDLDKFKSLNDCHGHAAGDLLLCEVASRLRSCVRQADTLARFAGDEFIVILCDLAENRDESRSQASSVAEKIRARLDEIYVLNAGQENGANRSIEFRCSASVGVKISVNGEVGEDDLFRRADAAMYRAKEAGGNLVRFHGEDAC
jgi:diguanylate cyclase (GGDEF)-like protein/PAS domain S-box-containing protein